MADLKVRRLDDRIATVLRSRAQQHGISLEEEVRRTLTASVETAREMLVERARALHAATGGQPGRPELDSTRTIREDRDESG